MMDSGCIHQTQSALEATTGAICIADKHGGKLRLFVRLQTGNGSHYLGGRYCY
jgi:hypothetical protein